MTPIEGKGVLEVGLLDAFFTFTIDQQEQTRLPVCLFGDFCPFRLDGRHDGNNGAE